MVFVKTPNEEKYKFYPAAGGVFTFKVCCSNDCFVVLSAQPVAGLPRYLIAIGGWSNTQSVIRQMSTTKDVAVAATPGIVNANEMRGFWIRWHDNVISVGREGETLSFMSYKDPDLFPVKYVGICTAYGATGSWWFDAIGEDPLNSIKGQIVRGEKMQYVQTPNEVKYKFYPAYGGEFKFQVSCRNDCYVVLSAQPLNGLPLYMIAIGGWSNTQSVIRQMSTTKDVAVAATPGIVNANEMRGFWIRWHDNVISVGREGETLSFMSYTDPDLFPVKYVGICTAYGATGSWWFDAIGEDPLNSIKGQIVRGEKMQYVQTPNEVKYKFYPAYGGEFKFQVSCRNDCYVVLSAQPLNGLPLYMIAIGGWSNTQSVIRQMSTTKDVAVAATPGIVNANEMRGFWIRWHDNVISVGREGETLSFMSYTDPDLFPVKYVGICTAYGATGSWLFKDTTNIGALENGGKKLTIVQTPKEKSFQFHPVRGGMFSFKVSCSNDCYVALSAQPLEGRPIYEIVLGGWNNSKSAIRQMGTEPPDVVEESTPGIVSADKLKGFWIRWYDNTISVGHEGETASFMSFKDPKLFPIKYVGVSTGSGSTGSWLFEDTAGAGVWVAAANGVFPPNALNGGFAGNESFIVARAQHENSLLPGRLHPSHGACYITHKGALLAKKEYEVLCSAFGSWSPVIDGNIPPNAVVAGYEDDGESLFIGRARHSGTLCSGKVQASKGRCYLAYGYDEIPCTEYEIYVLN